jgi:hypothetical protein
VEVVDAICCNSYIDYSSLGGSKLDNKCTIMSMNLKAIYTFVNCMCLGVFPNVPITCKENKHNF